MKSYLVPKTSVLGSLVGRYREDAFYLIPVATLLREGRVAVDFAVNRLGFEVYDLSQANPPAFIRSDDQRNMEPSSRPSDQLLNAFLDREYPGFRSQTDVESAQSSGLEAKVLRTWPAPTNWLVFLARSQRGYSCAMVKMAYPKAPIGFAGIFSGDDVLIFAHHPDLRPDLGQKLSFEMLGKRYWLNTNTVNANPDEPPAAAVATSMAYMRPFLTALRDARSATINQGAVRFNLDLTGSGIAINQLFEWISVRNQL